MDDLESQRRKLEQEVEGRSGTDIPAFSNKTVQDLVVALIEKSVELIYESNEVFSTLAPRFLKEFRVDKENRVIEAEFYDVPDFTPVLRKLDEPAPCINMVEVGGHVANTLRAVSSVSNYCIREYCVNTSKKKPDYDS